METNLQLHFEFKQEATDASMQSYATVLAKQLEALEQPWMIGEVTSNRLIAWVNVNAVEPVVVPASSSLDYVRIFRMSCTITSNEPLHYGEGK